MHTQAHRQAYTADATSLEEVCETLPEFDAENIWVDGDGPKGAATKYRDETNLRIGVLAGRKELTLIICLEL